MVSGKENQVFWCARNLLKCQMGHRPPPKVGELATDVPFTVMDLLPSNTHFPSHGTLMTPPGFEIQGIVLKPPIEISKIQDERFIATIGLNARPF
jgi:carbonic anhydrase